MNKFIHCLLLGFCIFLQSGESLIIPTNTAGNTYLQGIYRIGKEYKEGSLLFELQKNGTYCCRFKGIGDKEDKFVVMTNLSISSWLDQKNVDELYQLQGCKPIAPENCKIHPEMIGDAKGFSVKHWAFPTDFWNGFFLRLKVCQTAQCVNSSNSRFCFELPSLINEFYYNDANYSCYYLDNAGFVKYVDLLPSLEQYKQLFTPIFNIKNAQSSSVITIWKNVFIFLRNYFYDASGNKRLKNSLREVFLNNAGVVFSHVIFAYYAAVLLFMCQRNSSAKIIFAKFVVLFHLGSHVGFSYARITNQN